MHRPCRFNDLSITTRDAIKAAKFEQLLRPRRATHIARVLIGVVEVTYRLRIFRVHGVARGRQPILGIRCCSDTIHSLFRT